MNSDPQRAECGRSVAMLGRADLELSNLRLLESSAGELLTELLLHKTVEVGS
jgi:hypothetical protein